MGLPCCAMLYADVMTGRILGAEMIGPDADATQAMRDIVEERRCRRRPGAARNPKG